jgi:DNA-3-methyladenine glycosylase II
VSNLFRVPKTLSAAQLEALAEPWRPYRTVATWYVWRSRRMTLPSDAEAT